MNRFLREFRLVPVVMFATATLLVLKIGGLVTGGGYTLSAPRTAQAQDATTAAPGAGRAASRDMQGYPDLTGSVDKRKLTENGANANGNGNGKPDGEKPAAAPAQAPASAPPPASVTPDGKPVVLEHMRTISAAERAVLERLQERRQELDQRARELDIREGLLTSAERRIEARINELKEIEARISAASAKKDEADVARLKGVVIMYENMKAKDAARVFDRLDMRILIEVASQINPRRLSDIVAQMSPEAAERLTVELATRSNQPEKAPAPAVSDLPKIEGRPGG
jgi:flagellar motility protein MotE (MotC chaperone)